MGLLDDAIREHLELKRRRGADATEVSREESDALGPVRPPPEGRPDLSDLPTVPPVADAEPAEATAAAAMPAEPAAWEEATTVYEPPPIPSAPAQPAFEPPAAHERPAPTPAPAAYEPPTVPPAPTYEPDPDFDPFPELADEEPIAPPPAAQRGSLLSRFKRRRDPVEHQSDPSPAAHDTEPAPHEPAPPAPPAAYEPPSYPPPAQDADVIPAGAGTEPEVEDLLEETPDFLEETPEHDRLWFEQRPPRDFDFDG